MFALLKDPKRVLFKGDMDIDVEVDVGTCR